MELTDPILLSILVTLLIPARIRITTHIPSTAVC